MAKKNNTDRRVKLLVGIIGAADVNAFAEVCNDCCASLHFSGIAFGTAKSNYLSYLGIDEIEKRLLYALIPDFCESKLLKELNRRLRLYLIGNGIAFTVPLSGISGIIGNAILSTPYKEESTDEPAKKEKKNMHELVIAVVNQKYTDKVIDASRTAGATGATVWHTLSVNNKQVEQLVGTTLKQETDTVAILTTHEYKQKIMEEIRDHAGLKTDGGAVLFSLPVDSLIGIGRFEPEE